METKVLACEIAVRRLVQEAKEKQYKITCTVYAFMGLVLFIAVLLFTVNASVSPTLEPLDTLST